MLLYKSQLTDLDIKLVFRGRQTQIRFYLFVVIFCIMNIIRSTLRSYGMLVQWLATELCGHLSPAFSE